MTKQDDRQFNKDLFSMIDDVEEEKKSALEIFESKIYFFLDAGSADFEEILEDYNNILILLLSNIEGFYNSLKFALFSNQEKLTNKTFELNGKKTRPTVENWLKAFIKATGSGMFSNIDLTKYMTESENVKRLDDEERRLVKKLLRLYRNLVFFPDSLRNIPIDQWEIFPMEREGGDFHRGSLGAPKTEDEKELENLQNMEKDYGENSLEKLVLDEEIEKRKKIEEMRFMLKNYKEDSLEHRVLEEEILKMES